MALQDTYEANIAAGFPGMHANMEEWNGQTRTVANAPIKFGAPAQRDGARGARTLASGGEFIGLVKAMHAITSGGANEYGVGDNVVIVDEGCWYVKAEGLTDADHGKPARFNTATGAFTVAATSGTVLDIPGSEIDEVHGATLAVIRLRRVPA